MWWHVKSMPGHSLYQLRVWPYKPPDASVYLGSLSWHQAYDQNQCTRTDNGSEEWKVTKLSLPFKKKKKKLLLTLNMCFCWFFFSFFQTVSRWVIKIWNLKSIYEPADLMSSAGSVYDCVSSWATLHILLFLLPSQTLHPLCSSSTHSAVVSS